MPTTIRRVINATAKEFGIRASDICGNSRAYNISRPRAVCVLIARQKTKASFKQIGIVLGGRDHSTIHHLYHAGHKLIRDDEYFEAYLRIRDASRNTL
jgi:chromosomal replication initiator protein